MKLEPLRIWGVSSYSKWRIYSVKIAYFSVFGGVCCFYYAVTSYMGSLNMYVTVYINNNENDIKKMGENV